MKKVSKFISILILFLAFVPCSNSYEQNKKAIEINYLVIVFHLN